MTDAEWIEMRRKRYVDFGVPEDGNLNMMPHVKTLGTGEVFAWCSRQYVEMFHDICEDPEFKKSVALSKRNLGWE